jgi:HSP20 family protein
MVKIDNIVKNQNVEETTEEEVIEEEKIDEEKIDEKVVDEEVADDEETTEDKNEEFDYRVYGQQAADDAKGAAEKLFNDIMSTLKAKQDDFNETINEYKANKPPVDVLEYPEELVIKADLPRVNKENINIQMNTEVVEIEVNFPEESEADEDVKIIRKERCNGLTKIGVILTAEVDLKDVKATFEDQVLTLRLPKVKGKKVDVEIV